MNLSGIIASFGAQTYSVTRAASSSYVQGKLVTVNTEPFTVTALVQPLTGRELDRLPEGLQTSEVRGVWTTAALQVTGQPDVITIDGMPWQVELQADWSTLAGYRYYVVSKMVNQ